MLALLALPLLAVPALSAPADCELDEQDYYVLRRELRDLRRSEGESVAVAAEGDACGDALDTVLRNGPFLGVHRVETSNELRPGRCTAVLRPQGDSYSLVTFGDCASDSNGPSRMVTAAWWLPYGASFRWNEHIGGGVSTIVDLGWQVAGVEQAAADFGADLPPSQTMPVTRGLVGLDIGKEALRGGYLGVRGGTEVLLTTDGIKPTTGTVAFLMGHKWTANAFVLQAGAGVQTRIPLGNGPQFSTLEPMAELRFGVSNRR